MSEIPETQVSLLLRVSDPTDHEAWERFVGIYHPMIYRMARRRGLQDADAQDLSQKVLTSVSDRISTWQHDPDRGRFSTWLTTVTRNAIIDSLRRIRPETSSGGSSVIRMIKRLPATEVTLDRELHREYRRQMFRRAALEIRQEVETQSWSAFWMTAVEAVPIVDVAEHLGMSVGAVYAVRSRVMRRFKERIARWEAEHDEA